MIFLLQSYALFLKNRKNDVAIFLCFVKICFDFDVNHVILV